jgi:hypothetical protein
MQLARYKVVKKGKSWAVSHDGQVNGEYATKEAAFEAAVAVASLAIKQGHEVSISVPSTAGD